MANFGLLLKSYSPDFPLAQRLNSSFRQFNREGLSMSVVVPPSDVELFSQLASDEVTIVDEAALSEHLVEGEWAGLRPGYANQEIIKLAFWELGIDDNYLAVDSDAVFIRPFGREDFMATETTPYTFLTEDHDLQCDPRYFREHWQGRERHLRHIQDLIGLKDRRLLTCHGHQVLNAEVLRSLLEDFAHPREWSYRDLIAESPYEFSWYNFWLQKSKVIPLEQRDPIFKTIHHEGQHRDLALSRLTMNDLARGYVGLIVNSNFAGQYSALTPDEAPSRTLARYAGVGMLTAALGHRLAMLPATLRGRS